MSYYYYSSRQYSLGGGAGHFNVSLGEELVGVLCVHTLIASSAAINTTYTSDAAANTTTPRHDGSYHRRGTTTGVTTGRRRGRGSPATTVPVNDTVVQDILSCKVDKSFTEMA